MVEVFAVAKGVAGSVTYRARSAAAGVGCVSSVEGCESSGGAEADAILALSIRVGVR